MSALVKKLSTYSLTVFDYSAIGNPVVEQRARAAVVRIRELQKLAVVDIGRELLAVKELLPKGQFIRWVESIGLERRTAVNYMHVAAEFGSVWETVSHIPAGVLYKLAAPSTPAAVREAVMQIGPGKVVTLNGVRGLIDDVKAGERRKVRRDRRDEIKQEQEAQRAKWEARRERDERDRQKRKVKAQEAVQRMRSALGDRFSEICAIIAQADRHEFLDALYAATPQAQIEADSYADGGAS